MQIAVLGILVIAIGAGLAGYSYVETGYNITSYKDRRYLEPFSVIERVAPEAYHRYFIRNLTRFDTLKIEVHATRPVLVYVACRDVNVSQGIGYDVIITVIPPIDGQYYVYVTNLNKNVSLTYSLNWELKKTYTRTVFPFSGLGVFLLILGLGIIAVLGASRLKFRFLPK
jgi:hypothetical protein